MDYPHLGGGAVRGNAGYDVLLSLHAGVELDVCVEEGIEGLFFFAGSNGEHSGGLIHHNIVLILKIDPDPGLFHGLPGVRAHCAGNGDALREHSYAVSLTEGMVKCGDSFTVHLDLAL